MIAWRIPGSEGTLGLIPLRRRPIKPLTPAEIRFALADRIYGLVSKETPERARVLLVAAADNEGLEVGDRLETAGELLAENSNWLRSRAQIPTRPVPAREVKPDPEATALLEEETLETFLAELYRETD